MVPKPYNQVTTPFHCAHTYLFIFFLQRLPTISFFHSLHLPPLFIFLLTLSTKTSCLSLIPSQSDPHPLMAPKSKKSSYILSTDAFHPTHQNGVVRLTTAPPLTYRSQQHLSKGARARLVSFIIFFPFSSFSCNLLFLSIFRLVNAWALLWDKFR